MGKTKNKPGVMIYFEFLPMIECLKPMQRLALYEAMIYYGRDGTEPQLQKNTAMLWGFVRMALDRDDERYRRIVAARKKGGEARAAQLKNESESVAQLKQQDDSLSKADLSSDSQTTNNKLQTTDYKPQTTDYIPQTTDCKPQTANDNHQVANTGERDPAPVFSPPDYNAVMGFCLREGLNFRPEEFLDYYTANGWMVGQNPMRDWQAAARRWDRKENRYGTT